MAARTRLMSVLLSVLAVFLVSCFVTDALSSLGGGGSADQDDVPEGYYRSDAGGYMFKQLEGYELGESFGITSLLPPGADPETGPMIAMFGGGVEEEKDNETLLESMKVSMPEGDFSKEKKIKVDGKTGLEIEIEDTGDKDVVGRMIVVMVTPNQEFVLLGAAPMDEWKQVNKDIDKLLKTIGFFTPAEVIIEDTGSEPGGFVPEPAIGGGEIAAEEPAGPIRQWAVSAVASSQYADEGWSAKQAVGEPDVDGCEDDVFAWASMGADTVEWIELTYAVPVMPLEITIIQNYNPSQVVDVTGIGEDGTEYFIWEGEPEYVDYCPDYLTISFEPYEEFYINKLRITIDQSVLGLGWNEIDAVELVGMPQGASGVVAQPAAPVEPPATSGGSVDMGDVPAGKGFLTTDLYKAYESIPINEIVDLEPIIGPLKSSSGQLKPRADHMDTYVFDIGGGMDAYVAVTTSGLIYKKNIGQIKQVDMGVEFDRSTYETLVKMQKDSGYKLPYTQVAQYLGSPGLVIWHQIREDGSMRIEYQWFNSKGDRMWVAAYDGLITGSAGISFVPKE